VSEKLRVRESDRFWWTLYSARYEINFTDRPWQYTSENSGRFWGMREFFRRLGPAMAAYAGSCAVRPPATRVADGDKLLDATSLRAALLELK